MTKHNSAALFAKINDRWRFEGIIEDISDERLQERIERIKKQVVGENGPDEFFSVKLPEE